MNAPAEWTKSSYSGQNNDCVQWRRSRVEAGVDVGDTKCQGESIAVAPEVWAAFVAGVAGGSA